MICVASVDTPLGPMWAAADEGALVSQEFTVRGRWSGSSSANNAVLDSIRRELALYFEGKLRTFETPVRPSGTPFQERVWQKLLRIPMGETRSYLDVARQIGRPTAHRAVARVNATNRLAVIIPCHRVINTGGAIGGYGGDVDRKRWLLALEERVRLQDSSTCK